MRTTLALLRQTVESHVIERMLRRRCVFLIGFMATLLVWAAPHPAAAPPTTAQSVPEQSFVAQSTLTEVRRRGVVRCGVNEGLPGFGEKAKNGQWVGFDVDFCRALAAAIFNDPSKVVFTPVSAANRFSLLVSGAIDVLSRDTTWTLSREAGLEIEFPVVTYYDGQGFMVRKSSGIKSIADLKGATICVPSATTTQLNLADYFAAHHMDYREIDFATPADATKAYADGRCIAITADKSQLYADRTLLADPAEHVILPETISKEPLGPAVRAGDDRWLNIVKWTFYAMVDGEELGIGQKSVGEAMASEKAPVRRLLGTYGALGEALGLTNDWAARILREVGNYGEVFNRNLGRGSKLGIPRGLNRLWNKGGLQYSPPFI